MKPTKRSLTGLLAALFITGGIFVGCQKEAQMPEVTSGAKGVTSECKGTYMVDATRTEGNKAPNCATYTGTATTFEWTVTFPKGTQDVSHFSVRLDPCVDFTDILAVYYVDNASGSQPSCLKVDDFTYVIDKSLGCTPEAVAKFDIGGKSGQFTYGIVLRGNYSLVTGNTQTFIKSGAKSGCCQVITSGPGCPDGYGTSCNLSQGYWFRAPHSVWCEDVVLGNFSYDKVEGQAIWNSSNKFGISAAKRAFTQYSAIYLDQVCQESELTQAVKDAMATITSILGTTELTPDNIQTLQLTAEQNAALKQAASLISDYINELEQNCKEEDD